MGYESYGLESWVSSHGSTEQGQHLDLTLFFHRTIELVAPSV